MLLWSLGGEGFARILGYDWMFGAPVALRFLACLTLLGSAATVFCTGMIYASLPTIRQWQHPLVTPVYLVFSLATGAALLLAVAHIFGREQPVQVIFAAGGLIIILGLKVIYWRSIDTAQRTYTVEAATGLGHIGMVRQFEAPHTAQNYLMKEMGFRVARKHAEKLRRIVIIALTLAAAMSLATLVTPAPLSTAVAILAVLFAALAAITERWLFFAEAEHVVNLYYGKSAT